MRDRTFFFSNFERTLEQTAGVITILPTNVAAIAGNLARFGYKGPPVSTGEYPSRLRTSNYFARVDHRIAENHQLFVRYNFYHLDTTNVQGLGGLSTVSRGSSLGTNDSTVSLANSWTISRHTYNETRLQYFRSRLTAPPNTVTGPAITISGVANVGPTNVFPTGRNTDEGELSNSTTFERGAHSVKAGADFFYNNIDIFSPGLLQGSYSFSSLATFLTGRYTTFSQDFGSPKVSQRNPNLGLFLTDEWRVTPSLVLNFGVRYDVEWLPQSHLDGLERRRAAPRFRVVPGLFTEDSCARELRYLLRTHTIAHHRSRAPA